MWDIVPRLSERRHGAADRRVETVVIPFADRREDDRRLASSRRMVLRGSYAYGWLCFDNGEEKRRLTPIPPDWTTCTTDRIEEYLSRAKRVIGSHAVSPGESGGEVARAG